MLPAVTGAETDNRSNEALAQAVQQGDATALRALVTRHHAPLLGFLYRLTGGDRPLAEDLTQETMVRLLRGIGSYDDQRPFKPWLYQIGVNLVRDHYKQAEMRHTGSDNGEIRLIAAPERPETAVIQQQTIREAVTAVAHLPLHQRETLLLRYAEELSLAEIADILNIPVGTVKSRLSLALKRLREEMTEVWSET
jgi:RNA polymerase sigma-70 factor (ECF subfamily)